MAECLEVCQAALQQGLITEADYNLVKAAFVRAQQIKAGLDAGFIREEDYERVKAAFLNSLENLTSGGPVAPLGEPSEENFEADAATVIPSVAAPAAVPAVAKPCVQPQPARPAQPAAPAKRRPSIPTNIPKPSAIVKKGPSASVSGIVVEDDAVNIYYLMKARSSYRWVSWKVDDSGKLVVIADSGEPSSTYEEFLSSFPENDCRYAVYDYEITNSEGRVFNKLVFVNWAPDTAKVKSKMMYASTKDYFKGQMDGISLEVQASDLDELGEAEVAESVRSILTRQ